MQRESRSWHHSVTRKLESHAARVPGDVAVQYENEVMTFDELNSRANRLAAHLRQLTGGAADEVVAVALRPSIEAVVGILGLLKAGGAYTVVDVADSAERQRRLVERARPKLILTTGIGREGLPEMGIPWIPLDLPSVALADQSLSTSEIEPRADPDAVAYVHYVSGPDAPAIAVTHRSIQWEIEVERQYSADVGGVWAVGWSPNTASRPIEILLPLLRCSPVRLLSQSETTAPGRCIEALVAAQATTAKLPSRLLRHVLSLGAGAVSRLERLRTIIIDGAGMTNDLVEAVAAAMPQVKILERFVVPEAGGAVLVADRTTAAAPRVFKPAADTTYTYVLGETLQPVPIGEVGEIYVGGTQLARGYAGEPVRTARRFIANPYGNGDRLFRTGELARHLPDSRVALLGTADEFVTIGGRVTACRDIQDCLEGHPQVREAVVRLLDADGDGSLVGYVVPRDTPPSVNDLRRHAEAHLEPRLVPQTFVCLDDLPRTRSGAIDRDALPPPEAVLPTVERTYAAPRNAIETELAKMWAEVLLLERVGIYDDFLELGGDSLIATQLVARIWERFGTEVSIQSLFERGSIAGLMDEFFADPVPQEGV